MNRKPSQSGKTDRSEVSFEQLNKIRLTQGSWKGASQNRTGKTAPKDQKSKLADLATVVPETNKENEDDPPKIAALPAPERKPVLGTKKST